MGKDLKGKELGTGICQRKDGRYVGRFTDRFGKRREIKSDQLKELKSLLNTAIYEDKMNLNSVDYSITLDTWFEKWITIHKYKVISPNTKKLYIQIYQKHIAPTLGKRKLRTITQLQIKELIKKLDKETYRFETQNKVKILLFDLFDKAMIDNFVIKNPVRGIKIIRKEEKEIRVLSREEQIDFFNCCKGTFYDNLFVVAMHTGLRPGEVCALMEEDIDWTNREINVTKTLLYQKLEGDTKKIFHFEPPKTKSSNRKVPMNQSCSLALKKQIIQHRAILSKTPKEIEKPFQKLLFTTKYGTPINSQIYSDAIKKIIGEINSYKDRLEQIEPFSPHCFRHTFATRCLEVGIQPKTIQAYLGHATLQMTMDFYTHVLQTQKREEMVKLEEGLNKLSDLNDQLVEKKYNQLKR